MAKALKRRSGGSIDAAGGEEKARGGKIRGRVMALAKAKSGGFKEGGAITGGAPAANLAKRARGGRTGGSPFSSAGPGKERDGKSESGHEGE
jgi:hypothetical protein